MVSAAKPGPNQGVLNITFKLLICIRILRIATYVNNMSQFVTEILGEAVANVVGEVLVVALLGVDSDGIGANARVFSGGVLKSERSQKGSFLGGLCTLAGGAFSAPSSFSDCDLRFSRSLLFLRDLGPPLDEFPFELAVLGFILQP